MRLHDNAVQVYEREPADRSEDLMRVERALPGPALQRLRRNGNGRTKRSLLAYYYLAGEMVPSGWYYCTFCGNEVELNTRRPLPLCPACDNSEYFMLQAA